MAFFQGICYTSTGRRLSGAFFKRSQAGTYPCVGDPPPGGPGSGVAHIPPGSGAPAAPAPPLPLSAECGKTMRASRLVAYSGRPPLDVFCRCRFAGSGMFLQRTRVVYRGGGLPEYGSGSAPADPGRSWYRYRQAGKEASSVGYRPPGRGTV